MADMRKRIGSSVIFTIVRGRVLDTDKEAVAEFLGSEASEKELSRLCSTAPHEVRAFLGRIEPKGRNFWLYKGPSPHGGGAEEYVLAEVAFSS